MTFQWKTTILKNSFQPVAFTTISGDLEPSSDRQDDIYCYFGTHNIMLMSYGKRTLNNHNQTRHSMHKLAGSNSYADPLRFAD